MKKVVLTVFIAGLLAQLSLRYYFSQFGLENLLVGATLSEGGVFPRWMYHASLKDLQVKWPEARTSNGLTPIHFVCEGWQDSPDDKHAILNVVDWLQAQGVDVNSPMHNALSMTALHSAVLHRSLDLIEALLSRGARVNVKIQGGRFDQMTPLQFARHLNKKPKGVREYQTVIELLIKNGARD